MRRPPALTAFGLMNIGIGAFYAVLSLCMIIGGPWRGASVEAMGTTGVLASFVWIACIAIHLQLTVAGIGLFQVAVWGRTLSIAYGGLSLVINGSWFMMSLITGTNATPVPALALIYGVILTSACLSPSWSAAFERPGAVAA